MNGGVHDGGADRADGAHEADVFTAAMPLRWSDQDLNGHINNARVVTLFEEARLQASAEWLGSADFGPRLVRSLTVDYLRPLHYGPPATVQVWVARIGTTSFTLHHEIHQDGQVCAAGRVVMVNVDSETSRPLRIDASLRNALNAALIPEPAD